MDKQLSSAVHHLTQQDAWDLFGEFINLGELADEIALAARESVHGKAAYALLRAASDDSIPTLEGRLRLLDARNARS